MLLAAPYTSNAKTLRQIQVPAEFPPASFKGKQYVDSRGCVFIRAGFGGKVNWVPRVNRKRQVYCSKQNKPSLSASQLAALGSKPVISDPVPAADPAPAAKKQVVRKVVRKPVKTVKTPVVTVPRRLAVKAAPVVRKPVQVRRVLQKPVTQPRRVVVAPPKVVKKRPDVAGSNDGRLAIRRIPQAIHPGDLVRSRRLRAATAANAGVYAPPPTRTYTRRVVRSAPMAAPVRTRDAVYGLRTVGTLIEPDVTAAGDAQTDLVWTRTVPRRLIQRKTRVRQAVVASRTVVPAYNSATQVRVSSKSRYVQVGTFGVSANASKTVRRFQSGGYPVTSRRSVRSGKSYQVVYLGPFSSAVQLQSAMNAARRAGFRDAIYR